jgi:spore germination protein YaaH
VAPPSGAPVPPAPAIAPAGPKLFAYYSSGQPSSRTDLIQQGSRIAVLAPNWFTLSTADLTVHAGSRSPLSTTPRDYGEILAAKRVDGFELWPVINATFTGANGGPGPSAGQAQLGDAAKRSRIVAEIARVTDSYPVAEGVTLDVEGLWGGSGGASQRSAYNALVADAAAMLHGRARKLAIYAPGRTCAHDMPACTTWSAQSYDWAALSRAADLLTVAGYDHGVWAGSAPGPITTSAGWRALVDYAGSVSRRKIVPTVAAFG